MKYRLEGTSIESVDSFVRISLGNGAVGVTKKEFPSPQDVVSMLERMQGYPANNAMKQACSRASADAKNSKEECSLAL